jgi:hypothetical protein
MTLPIEVVKGREQPDAAYHYSPSQITLFGTPLFALDAWIGRQQQLVEAQISIIQQGGVTPTATPAEPAFIPALIHAFAYQGHCYNLPEPVILLVEDVGKPAMGFDFDPALYDMWKVDKLDRTLQLETTGDTFEEIILKRTLAGTKQPIAYASRAQISHRGGKLSE